MRKKNVFSPVIAQSQNKLIDAVENKNPYIVYNGDDIQSIGKQLKTERNMNTAAKFMLPVGLISLFTPGAPFMIAGGAATLLSGGYLWQHDRRFNKYNVFILPNFSGKTTVGFINRFEYSVDDDAVIYDGKRIKLTYGSRCPACKKKLPKDIAFGRCSYCEESFSLMTPLKKAKLEKLK